MTESAPEVDLGKLADVQPRLDAHHMATFAQAARVCLDRHHVPPIRLSIIEDEFQNSSELRWIPPTDTMRRSWGEQNDTIEWGAVGVTLAVLGTARGLVATQRAQRGSGADYYVAPLDASDDDLEGAIRLEISGIDRGESQELVRRLAQKIDQLKSGDSNTPGIAVVVGFSARSLHLATLGSP